MLRGLFPKTASAFRFDKAYGLSQEQVKYRVQFCCFLLSSSVAYLSKIVKAVASIIGTKKLCFNLYI